MSFLHEGVGRLVVAFIRWRFGRELRIAAAAGLGAVAVAGYLIARRAPPEG